MAFTGNFTVAQGIDPSSVIITDTSIGSDSTITDRQIRLVQTDGTLLLPVNSTDEHLDWPLGSNTITLTGILDKDYALLVQVDWITTTPTQGNVYEVATLYVFIGYLNQFSYYLTQQQSAKPDIVNDINWIANRFKLRVYMDSALNTVMYAQDQSGAQYNLDMATDMKLNQNSYF